jgi:cytochrome c oxidase assembly factor CtaG
MTTGTRSVVLAFVLAAISLVLAVVTGIDWLGKPLRMVNLLKIMGLSMFAGVTWVQAVLRLQQKRSDENTGSA